MRILRQRGEKKIARVSKQQQMGFKPGLSRLRVQRSTAETPCSLHLISIRITHHSVLPRLLLQGAAPCLLFVTPCPFEKDEMTPCPFD